MHTISQLRQKIAKNGARGKSSSCDFRHLGSKETSGTREGKCYSFKAWCCEKLQFSNCSLPLQVRLVRYQSMYHANIKLAEMMKYTHAPTQMPYVCHTLDEMWKKNEDMISDLGRLVLRDFPSFFGCVLSTDLPSAFHVVGPSIVSHRPNSRNVNISHSNPPHVLGISCKQSCQPKIKESTPVRTLPLKAIYIHWWCGPQWFWRFAEKHLIEYHESWLDSRQTYQALQNGKRHGSMICMRSSSMQNCFHELQLRISWLFHMNQGTLKRSKLGELCRVFSDILRRSLHAPITSCMSCTLQVSVGEAASKCIAAYFSFKSLVFESKKQRNSQMNLWRICFYKDSFRSSVGKQSQLNVKWCMRLEVCISLGHSQRSLKVRDNPCSGKASLFCWVTKDLPCPKRNLSKPTWNAIVL